jgi:fructosamine-3-kinase
MASGWKETVVATLRATPGAPTFDASPPEWLHIGGGATSVWLLASGGTRFFVKLADSAHADMLSAEVEALRALAQTATVRVPQVYASGQAEDGSFIALEWLDLVEGGRDAALGRALAQLHAHTGPAFGWHRDNTIGTTPQHNAWCADWPTFFRDRRITPQLELAARNGHAGHLARNGERLLAVLPALLRGHAPQPSLLHGDLWAGNAGRLADDTPVVFDPATYYGDRESDIAMTELFGGFSADFYAAYREASPLPAGYELRSRLYNLYHVLNHLNLFGDAYLARSQALIGELLALAA